MAKAHPHSKPREPKSGAARQLDEPVVDSLSAQQQGPENSGQHGHWFERLMQRKDFLRLLVGVYTHPIVSGIITLLLASTAFLTGVISGLGINFVPFVQKSELIATLFFYLSMVLFAGGLLRVMVLFIFNMFKERPQGVAWHTLIKRDPKFFLTASEAALLSIFCSFVACLLVIMMVVIFIVTLIPGYDSVVAVSVIFSGSLLAVFMILYRSSKRASALFLAQVVFLLSIFGLGRVWMDIQRLRPPTMRVHFKDGETVLGNVAFASPSGLLIFVSNNLSPEYHSWDSVEKVMLETIEGEKYKPLVDEERMKVIVGAFCRLKGAIPKGMSSTGNTDTDCKE
jgi:hypothetical protein